LRLLEAQHIGDLGGYRLNLHAEPAAAHGAFVSELRDHRAYRCGRDRESYADRAAGRREDHHVDADHLAVEVERRTAGIAFVDGCIDLQKAVGCNGADVALAGGDDAGGHRAAEPEWIADGQHPIPRARHFVRKLHEGEVIAAVDLKQGEVADRIAADHLGGIGLLIVGLDLCRFASLDHVIIGDGVAIRGNEEARSLRHHRLGSMPTSRCARCQRRSKMAEEVGADLLLGGLRALGLHAEHGRLDLIDDVRKARRTSAAGPE
jgi:hypothetical protein